MIMLTKLNDEKIILNSAQIEAIEFIPEAKIIMMNGKFYIVREKAEEIIEKTIEYNGRVRNYVNS
ncbi:flagellar FlbD family protein [Mediterraneibacter agrestimuris]|uniref:flagellar FlbD family protein n=1 Tax=Mediterraneibacter agrestimuris TaxID=2941333 RepID=UPI00203E48A8|nr:flagellar FlbD family protein [Mediterraneibacter agrestimuris]